jgi:hypothetical protein
MTDRLSDLGTSAPTGPVDDLTHLVGIVFDFARRYGREEDLPPLLAVARRDPDRRKAGGLIVPFRGDGDVSGWRDYVLSRMDVPGMLTDLAVLAFEGWGYKSQAPDQMTAQQRAFEDALFAGKLRVSELPLSMREEHLILYGQDRRAPHEEILARWSIAREAGRRVFVRDERAQAVTRSRFAPMWPGLPSRFADDEDGALREGGPAARR